MVDRVLDRALTLIQRVGDRRERELPEDEDRDDERDQRPIITPVLGATSPLPPPSSVAATMNGTAFGIDLDEEGDQARDERVEHARLDEGEVQELVAADLVGELGLASGRLDDLAEEEAEADARADGAEADADAERDRASGSLISRKRPAQRPGRGW